ncbi:GMC family oxidoreductase [Pseudomonas sp. Marseille-QA0892]
MPEAVGPYDYVIVGAGPAGCLMANRLSADPAVRVLLLEAGGHDNLPWIHIPVGYLFCIGNPRTDWCFKTEAEAGLGGRSIGYPRGRVLGGSSSINGMIYMRGQARDYDLWAEQGNAGWGWKDMLPLFKRMEDHYAGASEIHGAGGEWRVEKQRLHWDLLDAFREAAGQAGIPAVDDFNTGDNEGCGYFQVNQRGGIRWNAAKAFLKPVRNRPNLTIHSDVEVERLLLGNGRAQSVVVRRKGQSSLDTLSARREIILCAGAIGSPALLQRSGIGSPARLASIGMGVAHTLEGVGANLQDHLQLRMVYKVTGVPTLNLMAASLFGKLGMGWQYLLSRSGPLAMAPSQLGAFARSDPSQLSANLEYHVQPLSLERFGEPLHPFAAFTASVCNLRPASRGRVDIRSTDPRDPPYIQPNYLSDREDLRVAADAIRLTRRIVAAPALAGYKPEEYLPGSTYQTEEALQEAAARIGTTIFHPAGTCRMGNDAMAVVDSRLQVHGIPGLRVADASIMPEIVSGNTCSPTLAIAEKAAALIIEDARATHTAGAISTAASRALAY